MSNPSSINREKGNRLALIGSRFTRLLVVDEVVKIKHKGTSVRRWLCHCDCGTWKIVTTPALRGGQTKSCGCLWKESAAKNVKAAHKKKSKTPEIVGKNVLFYGHKGSAKNRGISNDLSKEEFLKICEQNCHYCDAPPRYREIYRTSQNRKLAYSISANGVDRINPNYGYTIDNSLPCCTRCNMAKSSLQYDEFLSLISLIFNHKIKKG